MDKLLIRNYHRLTLTVFINRRRNRLNLFNFHFKDIEVIGANAVSELCNNSRAFSCVIVRDTSLRMVSNTHKDHIHH